MLGGFQDGMLLQVKGTIYEQRSLRAANSGASFPYRSLPHEVTTWGEWIAEHPDTEVFTSD